MHLPSRNKHSPLVFQFFPATVETNQNFIYFLSPICKLGTKNLLILHKKQLKNMYRLKNINGLLDPYKYNE
jgi:hypothetical protein